MTDRDDRRTSEFDAVPDAESNGSVHAIGFTAGAAESFDVVAGNGSGSGDDYASPPDLSLVQADDALLDALGGSDPKVADGLGDQELNSLLLAWRRDIDSEPIPDLLDVDTAANTVRTAALAKQHAGSGRRRKMLVPVAAAAAVLAIAFTGSGLAARDAQPGDTLWGLTKVLYSDHARSVEAAANVRVDLQHAQLAITQGRFDEARQALEQARQSLGQVSAEDNADALRAQHLQLSKQLSEPAPPAQDEPQVPPAPGTTPSPSPTQASSKPTVSPTPGPELPPETTSNKPTPTSSTTTPSPSSEPSDGTGSETDSASRDDSNTNTTAGAAGPQPLIPPAG